MVQNDGTKPVSLKEIHNSFICNVFLNIAYLVDMGSESFKCVW